MAITPSPQRLGPYQLLERLFYTASGSVWAAQDQHSGRAVLVRALEPVREPTRLMSLRADWLAMATVHHPYLAPVLDEGVDQQRPYVVCAWPEGEPLAAYVGQPQPWGFVQKVGAQICDALALLHARGWQHIHLHPQSVFLQSDAHGHPQVTLLWPGIHRAESALQGTVRGAQRLVQQHDATRYLAPEFFTEPPWALGPLTDHYALGLLLWTLLTGDIPDAHLDDLQRIQQRTEGQPPALPPEVGGAHHETLSALFQRLLSPDPHGRPLRAGEISKALRALESTESARPPLRGRALITQRPGAAHGAPPLPLSPPPPLLVERDEIIDAVWQNLRQLATGAGSRMVILHGAPQSARTETARFVLSHAAVRGLLSPIPIDFSSAASPLEALRKALAQHVRAEGQSAEQVRARAAARLPLSPALKGEVADLLSALLAPKEALTGEYPLLNDGLLFGAPSADPLGGGQGAQWHALLSHVLRDLCRHGPQLLWLEDAHFGASEALFALCAQILREAALPICLLVSLDDHHPGSQRWREAWPEEGEVVRWYRLEPLSVQGREQLLSERVPFDDPGFSAAQTLLAQRPDDCAELLELFSQGLRPRPIGAPDAQREQLRQRRLQLLRDPTQPDQDLGEALGALALAQLPLSLSVLKALQAQRPDQPIFTALLRAQQQRWIERSPGGHWRFMHRPPAQWLAERLGERAHAWHHAWIAALQTLEGAQLGRYAQERAHHLERAQAPAEALQALLEGVQRHLDPCAPDLSRAQQLWTQAHALAQRLPDLTQRAAAHHLAVRLWLRLGESERAQTHLNEAQNLLVSGAFSAESPAHARHQYAAGWLALERGRTEQAQRFFQQALGPEMDGADDPFVQSAQIALAYAQLAQRGARAARSIVVQADELPAKGAQGKEPVPTPPQTGHAIARLILRAFAAEFVEDFSLSAQCYHSAQRAAAQRRWLELELRLMLRRLYVALRTAQIPEALALHTALSGRAALLDQRGLQILCAAVAPGLLAAAEDYTAAHRALREAELPPVALRPFAATLLNQALHQPSAGRDPDLFKQLKFWLGHVRSAL